MTNYAKDETYERLQDEVAHLRKLLASERERRTPEEVARDICDLGAAMTSRASAIEKAREALRCLYLMVPEDVARDVAQKVEAALAAREEPPRVQGVSAAMRALAVEALANRGKPFPKDWAELGAAYEVEAGIVLDRAASEPAAPSPEEPPPRPGKLAGDPAPGASGQASHLVAGQDPQVSPGEPVVPVKPARARTEAGEPGAEPGNSSAHVPAEPAARDEGGCICRLHRQEFEGLLRDVEADAVNKDDCESAVAAALAAWDAQASALAEARRLGACEKCGKEGPDVLPFWCEACAAGTLGQMDDYWKRIAVAESRATEAEARLAALAAPSPEPGPDAAFHELLEVAEDMRGYFDADSWQARKYGHWWDPVIAKAKAKEKP